MQVQHRSLTQRQDAVPALCITGMNREEHFYSASQLYKDSCAYQRPHNEEYSPSPPPCLYMTRHNQSVYASPALGAQDQHSHLPDITTYVSVREDLAVPHLHHSQGQQLPLQPFPGYGDSLDLCSERNRCHLPFPWMKSTKSHTHAWKGQWTGNGCTLPNDLYPNICIYGFCVTVLNQTLRLKSIRICINL